MLSFQFLIGTLKTEFALGCQRIQLTFQFLIGTLKTANSQRKRNGTNLVSIPHRYAKNKFHKVRFQPIYAFQFLIGTLKTAPVVTAVPALYPSFNSS